MEIGELEKNRTQTEQILDCVKIEKNDNHPHPQIQILIENTEETCVKLEKIENEFPVKNATSGSYTID